jgi:hypothetical protein
MQLISKTNGMNTSENNYDAIEALIFEENLKIASLSFDKVEDLFSIRLNTGAILKQHISAYTKLHSAAVDQLNRYEITSNGTGVHWDELDEDLSLKGFLESEIRHMVKTPAAA